MTLRSALVAIASVLASFGVMFAVCTRAGIDASPAILSAALAVGLSRDTEPVAWRSVLRKLLALPLVALAAGLAGLAFRLSLPLGAALFCGCIGLSIWLRGFGRAARAVSRIIALPFVAMLIVPLHVPTSAPLAALVVIAAGAVAVLCTSALRWIALRAGIVEPPRHHEPAARTKRAGVIDPNVRMALQMLVALALAFIAGYQLVPQHWPWTVLSAFIVCNGAVGRGDAIYKALLRLGGAIGGTLAAALLAPLTDVQSTLRAGMIFGVLFLAIWLRGRNYAYWAAGATLIFALLQGSDASAALPLFAERLAGIAIGALCAVAATWFVMPIRTEHIIRRRIADVLAAHKGGDAALLDRHLAALDRAAAPMMLHRRIFRRWSDPDHPAALVERTREFVRGSIKRVSSMKRDVKVYVSVAMTIDGYIDDRSEQRLILSNAQDMERVRAARAECDAVLVGAQTVRADNPSLRTIEGMNAPARVTVTHSGNLDPEARFFDGSVRTIVLASASAAQALRERLGDRAAVHALDDFAPASILQALHGLGIRSLFIEGGTRILTAFLSTGTFDRLRLAVAPFFAGDRGGARIADSAAFADGAEHRLILHSTHMLGDMAILEYERQPR